MKHDHRRRWILVNTKRSGRQMVTKPEETITMEDGKKSDITSSSKTKAQQDGSEANFWLRERLNDNDLVLLQQNLAEFTKDNSPSPQQMVSAKLLADTAAEKPLEKPQKAFIDDASNAPLSNLPLSQPLKEGNALISPASQDLKNVNLFVSQPYKGASAKKRDAVKQERKKDKEENKKIKTYGGTSKLSGGTTYCVFPFRYNAESHKSCIATQDRKRSWCALSSNYDRDSLWGYCDEDHDDGGGSSSQKKEETAKNEMLTAQSGESAGRLFSVQSSMFNGYNIP